MTTLRPPTLQGSVSSVWGDDRSYRQGLHVGLDFPSPKGTPALAAANGKVKATKTVVNSFAGKWVAVEHPDGWVTRYLHLNSVEVKPGQYVQSGQRIGTVGDTGTQNAEPHVHFDLQAPEEAAAAYIRTYGNPTPHISKGYDGWWLPAETFMLGASYTAADKAAAQRRGVVFYAGAGVFGLVAGGALLYHLFR